MLNRFKLLVLAIILAIFTMLFFQNQESLSLKFFCSDERSEYCFSQTPSISLAVWMAIFILLGIISSLGWQLLLSSGKSTVRERKSSSRASRPSQTATSYREKYNLREETNFAPPNKIPSPEVSDWEQRKSEDWDAAKMPNFTKDDDIRRKTPETRPGAANNVDKFSKDNELNRRAPRVSQTQPGRSSKESSNSDSSKNSVSQNREEIYDASYRTLNNGPTPSISQDNLTEDEEPDWI